MKLASSKPGYDLPQENRENCGSSLCYTVVQKHKNTIVRNSESQKSLCYFSMYSRHYFWLSMHMSSFRAKVASFSTFYCMKLNKWQVNETINEETQSVLFC